jgi:undecaprenyl-diphosphatase
LLAAICALIFLSWLTDEVFEGDAKHFDGWVRNSFQTIASPWLTAAMKFFSFVGSPLFLTLLGAAIVVAFFVLKWKRGLVLFLMTMIGEVLLSWTLKGFFRRARPEAFFDYPLPLSFSFPSGHALGSFCFFGILAWLVTARLENKSLKFLVWVTAVFLIAAIGLSRIYLGVHFPSDVVAGYTTGLIWVMVVAFGDFWIKKRTEKLTAKDLQNAAQ